MKYLMPLAFAGAIVCLLAGCNSSQDNPSASTASTAESNPASPTSRDTTSSPRSYDNTNGSSATEPDNTGRNVRDRSDATLTPLDQGGNQADRDLTRNLRRAITSNDQLSTTAKNIKIITTNGRVTLRGPVNTEQEKQTIEGIVKQTGVSSMDDQLEVKASQ